MKPENLKKLNVWLNQNIKDGRGSHDITNPSYNSLYFEIFFDEIENDNPLHGDKFCEKLELKEGKKEDQDQIRERFMITWNAWVEMYRKLNALGKIKS